MNHICVFYCLLVLMIFVPFEKNIIIEPTSITKNIAVFYLTIQVTFFHGKHFVCLFFSERCILLRGNFIKIINGRKRRRQYFCPTRLVYKLSIINV